MHKYSTLSNSFPCIIFKGTVNWDWYFGEKYETLCVRKKNVTQIPVPIDYPPLFLNARMASSRQSKKAIHTVKIVTQVYYSQFFYYYGIKMSCTPIIECLKSTFKISLILLTRSGDPPRQQSRLRTIFKHWVFIDFFYHGVVSSSFVISFIPFCLLEQVYLTNGVGNIFYMGKGRYSIEEFT